MGGSETAPSEPGKKSGAGAAAVKEERVVGVYKCSFDLAWVEFLHTGLDGRFICLHRHEEWGVRPSSVHLAYALLPTKGQVFKRDTFLG